MIKLRAWTKTNSVIEKLEDCGYKELAWLDHILLSNACEITDKTLDTIKNLYDAGLNVMIQHANTNIIIWVDNQRFTQR